MRLRKQELGDRNLVGSRVEAVRKQKGMKQKCLLTTFSEEKTDFLTESLNCTVDFFCGAFISRENR